MGRDLPKQRKPTETEPVWTATPDRAAPFGSTPAPTSHEAHPTPELPVAGHNFANISIFAEESAAPPDPPAADQSTWSSGLASAATMGSVFPAIQASLRVNTPGDAFEQEADHVAELVMRSPATPDTDEGAPAELDTEGPQDPIAALRVQRSSSAAGLDVPSGTESQIQNMQGGGSPLPAQDRSFFEGRFGHDFSQVRIHTDERAVQTSRDLNARAFTFGNDIAFDAGEYQPGTDSGRQLLAHELTHTIQQTGGVATKRVQRKAADEDEAEEVAAPESDAPETDAPEATPPAPAPAARPVEELVAETEQQLTDSEVEQAEAPPLEGQEVELPEVMPVDEGADTGGGSHAPAEEQAEVPETESPLDKSIAEVATEAAAVPPQPALEGTQAANAAPAAGAAAPAADATAPANASAPAADAAATGTESAAPEADTPPASQPAAQTADTAAQPEQPATTGESVASEQPAETRAAAQPERATEAGERPGADQRTAPGQQPQAAQPEGAAAAEQPDDEERHIQRMPAGRMVQRAPRSPDADPSFKAVTANVKSTAASQKQHEPARAKADQAAAAAQMPLEEKRGAAQNVQTGEINAAATTQEQAAQSGVAPGFDEGTFVAAVRKRIDELTPKDPKQMENIEGSGVFDKAKGAVDEKVATGKEQAQGKVGEKTKEAPDTSAVPEKPVTQLPGNPPGAPPAAIDARGAAPKPHGTEQLEQPVQAQNQQIDQELAQANITKEQLKRSNEPQFQATVQAADDAKAHAQQSLPAYRAQEQGQIAQAQGEAGQIAQSGTTAMHAGRGSAFGQMDGLQQQAKGNDEAERTRIGGLIDKEYQATKTAVENELKAMDKAVDEAFERGSNAARQLVVETVKRQVQEYKDKRYGNDKELWDVKARVSGAITWVGDQLSEMPPEYYDIYRKGREFYIQEIEKVLREVAQIVGQHLRKARELVQQGRDKIAGIVAEQPAHLREVAQQAADSAQSKFDDLTQTIDDHQQDVIDRLAEKYVEKLQTLDSELDKVKEENKTMGEKARDMVKGTIDTINDLKNLLLNTLQRAANAISSILKDPIGFLGNLLSAVKQGLHQFVGNIGKHLQSGLISWLTGTLAAGGIQLPATWDVAGIFSLVMQILGLTPAAIEAQIAKSLGPQGPQIIGALKQAWKVFQVLQEQGLAGLWQFVQDQIGDLKTMVMEEIRNIVITQVIQAGIEWVVSMLGGPAGAFIKAVQGIVRVVTWFMDNAARLASLVNSVIDSVMAIAAGNIGGAANYIEQSLAKALPTVISFLADLLGLGGIARKIENVIKKVRSIVMKPVDMLVKQAVAMGKKLLKKLGMGKKQRGEEESESTEQEKKAGLAAIKSTQQAYAEDGAISREGADAVVASVKATNPVFERLSVVSNQNRWDYQYVFRKQKKLTGLPQKNGKDAKDRTDTLDTHEDGKNTKSKQENTYNDEKPYKGADRTPFYIPAGENRRLPSSKKAIQEGRTFKLTNNKLSEKYPEGITFTLNGYPDFTPHAVAKVKIQPGFNQYDNKRANDELIAQIGKEEYDNKFNNKDLTKAPSGYVWHHHQDLQTMQLVPKDLHDEIRHSGGRAINKYKKSKIDID
ncbi:MAG: hypothetical protein OHK0022_47400 [Roseiflexaceae bacterium]